MIHTRCTDPYCCHCKAGALTFPRITDPLADTEAGGYRAPITLAEYVAAEGMTASEVLANLKGAPTKHSHYFKDVAALQHVDVYRVLALFAVTDPCLQHAVKKLLVAGGRGGGKDITRDIGEAIDTLKRWQEMRAEETAS